MRTAARADTRPNPESSMNLNTITEVKRPSAAEDITRVA